MVSCSDTTTRYLSKLGYNVIRLPYAGLRPPAVIGGANRGPIAEWLGDLPDLIGGSKAALPLAEAQTATDLKGRSSSAVSTKLGLNLLSAFTGALGGAIDLSTGSMNAKAMRFVFEDVQKVQVKPAAVSKYIDAGEVEWDSSLFRPYFDGDGRLFIITEVLTARAITACFESSGGAAATVKAPPTPGIDVGVKVSVNETRKHEVTYAGDVDVTFAFKCFEFGLIDGKPTMLRVGAGGVALSVGDSAGDEPEPHILTGLDAALLKLEDCKEPRR